MFTVRHFFARLLVLALIGTIYVTSFGVPRLHSAGEAAASESGSGDR